MDLLIVKVFGIVFANSIESVIFAKNEFAMIGQKYIPQTVTGDLAKQVKTNLPQKDIDKKVSKSLFPQKTTVEWK